MESIVFFMVGVSLASVVSSLAENLKFKTYKIREYDADKRAIKRICRTCRRKWKTDKNGALRREHDNLDRFIKISIEEEFCYLDYLPYIGGYTDCD